MAKYVPPHLRAAAAAPVAAPPRESWAEAQDRIRARVQPRDAMAVPVEEPPKPQSHTDWLKEQQSRYTHVVKTREELAAELSTMSFEQLRKRAGPPPSVCADEFVWSAEGCRPDDAGDSNTTMFDGRLDSFKKGLGPPPAPLPHNQPDYEGSNRRVNAYIAWYAQWGTVLSRAWVTEHPHITKPATKPKPKTYNKTQPEPDYVPKRVLVEVSEMSGW